MTLSHLKNLIKKYFIGMFYDSLIQDRWHGLQIEFVDDLNWIGSKPDFKNSNPIVYQLLYYNYFVESNLYNNI